MSDLVCRNADESDSDPYSPHQAAQKDTAVNVKIPTAIK